MRRNHIHNWNVITVDPKPPEDLDREALAPGDYIYVGGDILMIRICPECQMRQEAFLRETQWRFTGVTEARIPADV